MTKYFKLLNSFKGTRQTHCEANFNNVTSKMKCLCDSFRFNTLDRLFATYNLHRSDLYGSDTDMMAVPDKTSSIIGPEIFHFLEFKLSNLCSDGDLLRVLKYSFTKCPKLQSINIMFDFDGLLHPSLSLRHKNGEISSDQATCDINFLQMDRIRPVKNLFDLVTTHLQNIEFISLKAIDWGREFDDPIIDLTGFKKLKSFEYISTNNRFVKENQFISIKYINGREERRFLDYDKTKGSDSLDFTLLCDVSVSLDFRKEEEKN
ncbi:hypothetical protein MFLAVUS_003132 [Mucor flavus]|uniref:Uncharacterized protein n=1 Tax=Mucor flavus TaxID=439312 RepID=A0ABP9YS70_9FUNG